MDNYINEKSDLEVVDILENVTETSQQEAVQTIERANSVGMHPDDYTEMKPQLEKDVIISERTPAEVDPAVKNVMKKSAKHSEAIKPEIGTFNKIAKQAKFMWYNLYEKRDLENEIFNLEEKDEDGKLEEGELEYLNGLYDLRQEEVQSFDLEGFEQAPGQAVGVVGDMVEAIKDNAAFIALSTGGATVTAGIATGGAAALPAGGTALGLSLAASFGMNAYRRVKLSTRGELRRMKDDDGQPLNLPKETINDMSRGVGVISGVLESITGKLLTGGITKLGSAYAGKQLAQKVVKNTALKTATTLLGHVTKVAVANGGEEMASELASLVSENYAKLLGKSNVNLEGETDLEIMGEGQNVTDTLTSSMTSEDEVGLDDAKLANAIMISLDQIKKDPEVRKRFYQTGVVGALGGGGTATITTAPFIPKIKANLDERNVMIQKRNEAIGNAALESINHQNETLKLLSMFEESKIQESSPQIMSEITSSIFDETEDQTRIFINKEDMDVIEKNNPEVAAKLKALDTSESTKNDTESPLSVVPHQFYDLVKEGSSLTNWARLNPEAPNPLESRNFLKRVQEIEQKRNDFLSSLGDVKELTPEQAITLESLNKEIEDNLNTMDDRAYIESPVMSKYIESVVPENQVESFSKAQTEARMNVLEEIESDFKKAEVRLEDSITREKEIAARKKQIWKHNKDLAILENYKVRKGDTPLVNHKKKNYPKWAIDPISIPENLREAYTTDPKLIKRKVFVEGGITLEEAAAFNKVESGEELLKILANAPTQKELVKMRKDQALQIRKATNKALARTSLERQEANRNKVFDDENKIHYKEMNFMKEKKWPATKQGIKLIALPIKPIGEIQHIARVTLAKTKVNEVNVRQYNAGKNLAQRRAINHILKNETEKAFLAKEKVILNNELTRESLRVRDKIKASREVLKRITSKKGLDTFKKAGMLKDVTDILDLFDLTDKVSNKKRSEAEANIKFIKDAEAKGITGEVDESLSDIRQNGSDLTTEQFFRITERLQTFEHQAKKQNQLYKLQEQQVKNNKIQTEEAIVEDAVLDLQKNHPDYDEKRLDVIRNKNSKTLAQKVTETYGTFEAMFTNYKNVVTQLDRDKLLGKHYDNLVTPMVNAENFKRSKSFLLVKQIKDIINDYGEKDFNKAFNEFLTIDEFKGFKDLGDGEMARSDLWLLWAYLGDPQGRDRIQNFVHSDEVTTMTYETVLQALEKHLTDKDAKAAQNFINIFKSFEEDSKQLHFRTTGVMPTMVKAIPITFKGKVYEGGYVPLKYLNTSRTEKATRFLNALGKKEQSMFGEKGEENKLYSRLKSMEQTEQGRMEDRLGSSRPLDINFMHIFADYEETIHDLAYREAGSDTLQLLRNPIYGNAIISTVGDAKYQLLMNSVIETVGKVGEEDTLSPFNTDIGLTRKGYRYFERGFNIAVLGFNTSSVLMQPLSLGAAKLRMGPKGAAYLTKALATTALNIKDYKQTFARATEINPDLLFNQDSVDDTVIQGLFEFVPTTNKLKKGEGIISSNTSAMLKRGHQNFVDMSMIGLKKTDVHIKAQVTLAAYAQFMDGNVDGFPMSKLDKMTDNQKEVQARKYAKQISDLALTTSATIDKSSIEKIAQMRIITRFYTDRRSQLNTAIAEGRKIKYNIKEGVKAIKEGDNQKALSSLKTGGKQFASLMTTFAMMQLYQDLLRGQQTPLDELKEVESLDDFKNFLGNSISYATLGAVEALIGSTVIGGDLQYAIGSNRKRKTVNLPLTSGLSDIAMAMTGIADLLQGESLSKSQKKALLFSASLLGPSIPINGPNKIIKWWEENDTLEGIGNFISREANRLSQEINNFSERHKNNPEKQQEIKELQELQRQIIPPESLDIKNIIPEDSLEVLKTNNWDDLNTDTGAAGAYQFTEERWNEIAEADPTLGLTDNGRVSKDTKEQERAMQYANEENGRGLMAYQLPVNNINLYGAHRFGLDDYVLIALSKGDEKLNKVVSDMTLFKGFTSVKQVRTYVNKQVGNK